METQSQTIRHRGKINSTGDVIKDDAAGTLNSPRLPITADKRLSMAVIRCLKSNFVLLGFMFCFMLMIYIVTNFPCNNPGISEDFEVVLSRMEKFSKTKLDELHFLVKNIDKKLDYEINSLRKDIHNEMKKNRGEIDSKLKESDETVDKFMNEVETKSLLNKEEFGEFFEGFMKEMRKSGGEVKLDEIKDFVRHIVNEGMERHAADGLGTVDYALASVGAYVIKHSQADSDSLIFDGVSILAKKMLSPSFGEPGECFPLSGTSGFIEIRLMIPVVPEAITLEHVAKSVSYIRSSAPRQCKVYGWRKGLYPEFMVKKFLLTEFTYDLNNSNVQSFQVLESAAANVIDTVRLEFSSNHGNSYTCIYRLRLHGHPWNS